MLLERGIPMSKVIYDNEGFFKKYSQMARSKDGLAGAGEWPTLKKMLPDFKGQTILDLGCGYGWHCRYARDQGATKVIGIDASYRMLEKAKEMTTDETIVYLCHDIQDLDFDEKMFDSVISSLVFHYLPSFEKICDQVKRVLKPKGEFVFSVEHPIFTAQGKQDWDYDDEGNIRDWPVDDYFIEGKREAVFLGETMTKYHRTLTTYLKDLLNAGFEILDVQEPMPPKEMLDTVPGMKDELRRPMMLLVKARLKD